MDRPVRSKTVYIDPPKGPATDAELALVPDHYRSQLHACLIPRDLIQFRIRQIAADINADFEPPARRPISVIPILNGAKPFADELVPQLCIPFERHDISVSSYTGAQSGTATITDLLPEYVRGRHVIILEDIIDTGNCLDAVAKAILPLGPLSMTMAVLLDKPTRRTNYGAEEYVTHRGFIIPDEFVVGKGPDFNQKYRDLDDVWAIKPEIYR